VPVPAAAGAEAAYGSHGRGRREPPPDPVARARHPHRRALMLAGLAFFCIVIGAGAALIGDDGRGGDTAKDAAVPKATKSKPQGSPTVSRAATPSSTGATATTPAPSASSAAPADTSPSGVTDDRSAAAINNAGYAMLPGDPQGALPLLERAVVKFREAGDTKSTDYAYSLYNYGWALRLAGRPADAIPYLQERLEISDYERGTVERELRTAQQAAGQATTGGQQSASAGTSGAGPGNPAGHGRDKAKRGKGDGGD
jgi:eukaryotic-like serine/threonine-protein kinase